MVDQAKVRARLGAAADLLLRFGAGGGVVVHIDGGRIDADDALAEFLLRVVQRVHQRLRGGDGGHQRVDAVFGKRADDVAHGFCVAVPLENHVVHRVRLVAEAQQPVGADQHARQGKAAHLRAGKLRVLGHGDSSNRLEEFLSKVYRMEGQLSIQIHGEKCRHCSFH